MYFRSLQILRGLAALAVVLFHMHHYLPPGDGQTTSVFRFFTTVFSLGTFYFFVLSGFLMAYLIDISYRNFLLRRILRIYPSFIIAVVLVSFGRLLFFGSVEAPRLPEALTLLPLSQNDSPINYPLGVEWTLVYEVFFYLICSIFSNHWLRGYFLPFSLVWALFIIYANQFTSIGKNYQSIIPILLPSAKVIVASPLNLLFVAGVVSYFSFKTIKPIPTTWMYIFTILSLLLFSMALAIGPHSLTGIALMCLSIGWLVTSLSLKDRDRIANHKTSGHIKLMERLGDYSYAIYLTHVPIISLLTTKLKPWILEHIEAQNLSALFIMTLVLMLGWQYGKLDMYLHHAMRTRFIR